jgi:hypothetical protein
MECSDNEFWSAIPAVYSQLYDKLKTPSGSFDLLPISGCIGKNAKEALDNINEYTRSKGFHVSDIIEGNILFRL